MATEFFPGLENRFNEDWTPLPATDNTNNGQAECQCRGRVEKPAAVGEVIKRPKVAEAHDGPSRAVPCNETVGCCPLGSGCTLHQLPALAEVEGRGSSAEPQSDTTQSERPVGAELQRVDDDRQRSVSGRMFKRVGFSSLAAAIGRWWTRVWRRLTNWRGYRDII